MHGAVGAGQRLVGEVLLGMGANGLNVDPDSGQRVAVEVGEQARPGAQPGPLHDQFLHTIGSQPVCAQYLPSGLVAGYGGQQQMFAAHVVVAQAAGVQLGVHDDPAGLAVKVLAHHARPIRLPYLRCTVCLVTPSRSAICCQDQPSRRALSTCTISSRSASSRSAATARNPTSGSSSAAFW